MFNYELHSSFLNFHLNPVHTAEDTFGKTKFAPNQLLVLSNFKDLFSSNAITFDVMITVPHRHKFFFSRVEDDLKDHYFFLSDDNFNLCDLLGWVKSVTICEGLRACFARLPIIDSDSNCQANIPLHLCDP